MANLYDFLIVDKAGNTIGTLDSARGRNYSLYLNRSGDAGFEVSPTDPKITADLLQVGSKELYIYRANTKIWGGELSGRRVEVSEGHESVNVSCKGFFDLLAKKIIGSPIAPLVYSAEDAADIAWDLIDRAQTGVNASFGITRGAHPVTKDRDRTYDDYKTVKQAIEEMSSTNIKDGFDFDIDVNKQFSVYYPKGQVLSDIIFEWGRNMSSFTVNEDATGMANEVIAIGAGTGSEMLVVTRDSDTSIQETFKIRQKTLSYKDVSVSATLQDHADQELTDNQIQQVLLGIKYRGDTGPPIGSYFVGDSVRVKINYGLIQIDGYFRISGIKVKVGDGDEEDIELQFD
jgi:hypothetical protein